MPLLPAYLLHTKCMRQAKPWGFLTEPGFAAVLPPLQTSLDWLNCTVLHALDAPPTIASGPYDWAVTCITPPTTCPWASPCSQIEFPPPIYFNAHCKTLVSVFESHQANHKGRSILKRCVKPFFRSRQLVQLQCSEVACVSLMYDCIVVLNIVLLCIFCCWLYTAFDLFLEKAVYKYFNKFR